MMLSSSILPNLKFSQGLFNRLSKRTQADSNPNSPVFSMEGTSRKEMLSYNVPPLRMSMPDRSNPWVLSLVSVVSPGTPVCTSTLLTLSRCQCGVMRNATGQYDGFCQIGESRSFINWYPLSLNVCPKTFSLGHASWQ